MCLLLFFFGVCVCFVFSKISLGDKTNEVSDLPAHRPNMSRVVRKSAFCICENKDADQLRGNREANQRLRFRYTASYIPLLPKSEISSF